ncbi:MAG: cyclopropane fatty acyl phospholipid synthase [Gammaproteobacteria bacterium]|nr:cyclopropane fatty acyl phospholipid synthase [Gammaproteobacteria bacterium]
MKSIRDRLVIDILEPAGIKINGNEPWDPQMKDERIFKRIARQRSLGLGEAYMDGWWECANLEEFFYRVLSLTLSKKENGLSGRPQGFLESFLYRYSPLLMNQQTFKRSTKVAYQHYDVGNDVYDLMLGKDMQYTCAYWQDSDTLDEAQYNKLDLICRKLKLKEGMSVLELGGGFGGLARFMAQKYGCSVTVYNIAREQIKRALELTKGLKVNIIESDYRNATGVYDRVAAIGIAEHVGFKNYREMMEKAYSCLKDQGLFIIHTNGSNNTVYHYEPWMGKYIFPNSMIPSAQQLASAFDGLFMLEDWHVLSGNYYKTLMSWHENFVKGFHTIKGNYDEKFYKMWCYYLLFSAASHRSRAAQLWHLVLSKNNMGEAYISER